MAKTILLTGITGFIAKRIAHDLLNKGYNVRGSLRSASREDEVRAAVAMTGAEDRLSFVHLDLTSDDGWDAAMEGVDAVIHTASPFPLEQPKDEQEIIQPAVDGALRALKAAQRAGVTRVILTASMVTMMHVDRPEGHKFGPEDWTDPDHQTATAYTKSKTLAEKAAWDFVAAHPEMRLTTIHPGLVVGTPVDEHFSTSLAVIERIMKAKDPMQPDFDLPIVDIEDTSTLHIAALEDDTSAGERIVCAESCMSWLDIARLIAEAYPDRCIRTRKAPWLLLKLMSFVDSGVRTVLPQIGHRVGVDNAATRQRFGFDFIPARDSLLSAARAVDETGRA